MEDARGTDVESDDIGRGCLLGGLLAGIRVGEAGGGTRFRWRAAMVNRQRMPSRRRAAQWNTPVLLVLGRAVLVFVGQCRGSGESGTEEQPTQDSCDTGTEPRAM